MHEAVFSLFCINDGMETDGNVEPRMSDPPVYGPLHDNELEICKYRTYESSFHVKAVSCIYIFVVEFCNGIVHIQ